MVTQKKAQALSWIIVIVLIVVIGAFFFLKQPSQESEKDHIHDDSHAHDEPAITIIENSDTTTGSNTESNTESDTEPITQDTDTEPNIKEISVIAKQWEFDPDPIRVNKGDNVILNIKSIDVSHGFSLPTFGVSERLNPGKEIRVEFIADKKGTFTFFCNVQCGSGHGSMRGQLIVE